MKIIGSAIGIALVLVYAVGSGMLVNTRDGWYGGLNKASWQPPAYIPGLIWPYSFVVLGIAAVLVSNRLSALATSLYLAIDRHKEEFAKNHRMSQQVFGLKRLTDLPELKVRAQEVLKGLDKGTI